MRKTRRAEFVVNGQPVLATSVGNAMALFRRMLRPNPKASQRRHPARIGPPHKGSDDGAFRGYSVGVNK